MGHRLQVLLLWQARPQPAQGRQCTQAYYCNADCQRNHWKSHKPVCRAAVAAQARRAHRIRVARAVREKDNVEEGVKEEDKLCVICQDQPKDAVEVRGFGKLCRQLYSNWSAFSNSVSELSGSFIWY